ncbi:hypothetical protein OAS39_03075 [Pirellulales bacterium]|nr:hypothetical protein [Pirellulales bacterium]
MPRSQSKNLFYVLLVPVGVVFVVTAFAQGVVAFQAVYPAEVDASSGFAAGSEHALVAWLRTRGNVAMLVELAVLAALTVAAIAYDRWHMTRSPATHESKGE